MKHVTRTSALALVLATTIAGAQTRQQPPNPQQQASPQQQTSSQQQAKEDYCAHGFVTAQTQKDGAINKEEAKQLAQREYDALDAKHDGRVTPDEFKSCLTRGGATASASQPQRQFAQAGMSQEQSTSGAMPSSAHDDASFEQAGPDANGTLNQRHILMAGRNEFRQMLAQAAAAGQQPPKVFVYHFIAAPDSDQSAQASSGSQGAAMSENEAAARTAYGMKTLDEEGDGTIDRNEWRAAHQGISPAKADALFKKLDTNGDGTLTRDEYVNARSQSFDKAQQEARVEGGTEDSVPIWIFYVNE
jgi:Ca2+-binding EF-hand superfamily protein